VIRVSLGERGRLVGQAGLAEVKNQRLQAGEVRRTHLHFALNTQTDKTHSVTFIINVEQDRQIFQSPNWPADTHTHTHGSVLVSRGRRESLGEEE